MRLLPYMVGAVLNLVAVAMDLMVILVLVRLVCRWRPARVLSGIDMAASPVVNGLMDMAEGLWSRLRAREPLSDKGKLLLGLALLLVVRLAIDLLWLMAG